MVSKNRRIKQSLNVFGLLLLWLISQPTGSLAQEKSDQKDEPPAEPTPMQLGPYQAFFSGSVGGRVLDLRGNQAKYDQLFNLQDGFRLFGGDLELLANDPNQHLFDRILITTQGLGGDPYPLMRLSVRKNGVYEIRAGYRTTQYFYDLPETMQTPNRGWIDRRRVGDADIRYTPTTGLQLRLFYNRTQRDGTDISTGPFLYFPLSATAVGAFGRANTLPWVIPIREKANLFGGTIDWHWRKTNVHVEQSYRTYSNPADLSGYAAQPLSLLGPQSPANNLTLTKWNTYSSFNLPITMLHVEQDVTSRLRLRSGYIYEHSSGPANLDGTVRVPVVPTADSPATSISTSFKGNGTTNMTNHTADAGFTLRLFGPVELISDYRYQTYTQLGLFTTISSRSDFPTIVPVGNSSNRWDYGTHNWDSMFSVVPFNSLSIRAGVRFTKQDVIRKTDGQIDDGTRRSWNYSPLVNVSWRPSQKFRITGQFEHQTNVDPYVRISPESTVGGNTKVRYTPSDKWGIENTFTFRNRETEILDYRLRTRSDTSNAWYQPIKKLSLNAGFTYSSFFSDNSVSFLTGVRPLTGIFSFNQTIDRIVYWGIKLTPQRKWTLTMNGQFLRSNGSGSLTGENTTYGPLTWPAWNAELAYQLKRGGKLVYGWNHSYYYENLARATEFRADSFTFRWDFSF